MTTPYRFHSRTSLAVVLALSFFAAEASADTLIAPAKGTDVPAAETAKYEQDFINAYSVARRDRILVTRVDETSLPPVDQVAEAKRVNANEYIVLTFASSSGGILARASKHSADGTALFVEKVTFKGATDSEVALKKLAEALAKESSIAAEVPAPQAPRRPAPVAPPPEPMPVEQEEIDDGRVKEKENIIGTKIGIFGTWANGHSFDPTMAIGFHAKLEQPGYFVEVGAGFAIPAGAGLNFSSTSSVNRVGGVYAEMGAGFYLGGGDVGPYIGGGLLPRLWSTSGIGAYANVAAYGQFGVMFFRSKSLRIFFDGRAAINVTSVPVLVPNSMGFGSTQASTNPLEYGGEFGIGW